MSLIGLLCFYDEPLSALATSIKGMSDGGIDHVIAVDGAYALFPDGEPASHPDQHAVIHGACRTFGLGLTVHTPRTVWAGNEIEKRTFMFRLAEAVTEPGDWLWVIDADEVVTRVPDDLRGRLSGWEHDVAYVRMVDTAAVKARRPDWPTEFETRRLYRAQPIHLETNHYTYVTADGRVLWEGHGGVREVPALDLTDVVEMEHRPLQRPQDRQRAKAAYYTVRDEEMVERGMCVRCDDRAVIRMPVKWTFPKKGAAPISDLAELCDAHAREAAAANRRLLRQHGIDPAGMRWHERYKPVAA